MKSAKDILFISVNILQINYFIFFYKRIDVKYSVYPIIWEQNMSCKSFLLQVLKDFNFLKKNL